jgi:hypothetical protein
MGREINHKGPHQVTQRVNVIPVPPSIYILKILNMLTTFKKIGKLTAGSYELQIYGLQ